MGTRTSWCTFQCNWVTTGKADNLFWHFYELCHCFVSEWLYAVKVVLEEEFTDDMHLLDVIFI